MFDLSLQDNIPTIIDKLTDLEKTQLPFALSAALNDTAFEARKAVVDHVGDVFTIRGEWSGGFRVEKATKSNPVAGLGSLHDSLALHSEGGTLRAKSSSGRFVPTLAARQGGVFSGKIQKGLKPRALMRKISSARKPKKRGKGRADPKPFLLNNLPGGGSGIFIRSGASRLPIVRLFSIKDEVKIDRKFNFEAVAERVAATRLRENFISRLDRALTTAKGGEIKSSYVAALKASPSGTGGFAPSTLSQITR
ncbi:hypothetical protein [Kiloniella laminariae]|uniref:hypothetical protein n=1 Tax=Kiloniella laminariae TaxID=454162 RepID=UPI00035DBA4D|nr:hypothetical protein [Kiloniella laminariae]